MRYRQETNGRWVRPVMRGYKMMCCDCGLVHKLNFKVIRWGRGHKVVFQAFRLNRSTGQARRKLARDRGLKRNS